MKKQILLLVCVALLAIPLVNYGQYTNDVTLNTQVSVLEDDVTGVTGIAVTESGKTYITYLDGYFELKIQLLDDNGNKVFDSAGLVLETAATSYSVAKSTNIITDASEQAIVAFWNWDASEIKLFSVSSTGTITDTLMCGTGSIPVLEPLPSGAFILAFSRGDSTVIKKITSTAGLLATEYTRSVNYLCRDMVALPNGNFYMVSFDLLPNPGYAYTFANYIDGSTGNPLWANWTACSSNTNTGIYTANVACAVDNANFLYVSNTYFSGMNRTAFVQRIDSTGNALWGVNGYTLITDGVFNYQQRIFTLYDNSSNELLCLINGQNVNDGSATNKICYQKISQNGIVQLPSSGIELAGASTNAALFGMDFCDNNIAFTYISGITNYIYASQIDPGGTFQWSPNPLPLNITANAKSWVDALLKIKNNDIFIAFHETRSGHSGAYAQKAGCNGLLPTGIINPESEPVPDALYPNPATEKITLECNNQDNSTVSVYSITGKLMLQKAISETKITLDISDLPQGLYMIKISNSSQPVLKKFVIE
ncbi:MAG TPA: T9SS type A sorting domain-containing protein [Bacteroidales bacterium]|nr:T9SS type A sorting domain-containing protein [Bacteroidales bacterium]HNZ41827.1 T9SS type A sorting domain-containing protein [Bacteroidales bacterium]HOH84752.1 T9SS type A sorting domain-containing protein [Bacteroidales bacterium]HPB24597.1 T9SS type A sorting domain-containing protein [Bacteroidales bacterium]HPI29523.1 T9SS type A sorting domain-containing protein [Bacteroidales bacterium]